MVRVRVSRGQEEPRDVQGTNLLFWWDICMCVFVGGVGGVWENKEELRWEWSGTWQSRCNDRLQKEF